jgi:transposase-like protein
MPLRDPRQGEARSCPACHSFKTIRTDERFGEQTYFCADCEHTWSVRAADASDKAKKR